MAGDVGDVDFLALSDVITPYAIRVAATLCIADHIAAGNGDLDALARAAGADAPALGRVLRHLSARGVFCEVEPRRFALTAAARMLLDDHPARLRTYLSLDGLGGRLTRSFAALLDVVRTGEPAYPALFGAGFWEDVSRDRERSETFESLQAARTNEVAAELLEAYDWAQVRHVVDVGGGAGTMLAALLHAHPRLRGTLVERPAMLAQSDVRLAAPGVAERFTGVEQSFFDPLPRGADVYLLSFVLLDWSDRDAATILRRCGEAAGAAGRTVVVERVVRGSENQRAMTAVDLRLLALLEGHERTREEFERLGAQVGMALSAARPLPSDRTLLEFAGSEPQQRTGSPTLWSRHMNVHGIDATYYTVRDIEAQTKFYSELFGAAPQNSWPGRLSEWTFGDGNSFGLYAAEGEGGGKSGSAMFAVDDVARTVAEATARGVKFLDGGGVTESPVCEMAFGEDPEGNQFILHHRKPQ